MEKITEKVEEIVIDIPDVSCFKVDTINKKAVLVKKAQFYSQKDLGIEEPVGEYYAKRWDELITIIPTNIVYIKDGEVVEVNFSEEQIKQMEDACAKGGGYKCKEVISGYCEGLTKNIYCRDIRTGFSKGFLDEFERHCGSKPRYLIDFCFNLPEKSSKNTYTASIKNLGILPYKGGEGISIVNIEIKENVKFTDETIIYSRKTFLRGFANLEIGKKLPAYRLNRNKWMECDIWDIVKPNARNFSHGGDLMLPGSKSIVEFLSTQAPTFTKYGRVLDVLSRLMLKRVWCSSVEGVFFSLCFLYWYYPGLALLPAMGDYHLVKELLNDLDRASSKELARIVIDQVYPLFDTSSTEGHKVVQLPKHVAAFLAQKEAPIKDYIQMMDFIRAYPKFKDKEQFEKFITSECFLYSASGWYGRDFMNKMTNLFKYGYKDWEKLWKYIISQITIKSEKDGGSPALALIPRTIDVLLDYHEMCDFMNIDIDLWPEDLDKRHLELSRIKSEKENELSNVYLREIAKTCTDAVQKINDDNEDYVAVFPSCVHDFVSEGQNMHNCVGGYFRNVVNKYDIIFFIRRKATPERSYVTAEYRMDSKRLGQCYRSHNRYVEDNKTMDFARKISNALAKIF